MMYKSHLHSTMLNRPKSGKGALQHDLKVMQGTIEMLQQQLALSQNETQKVMEQLNCLILLVKNAWTGDKMSAIHVANIVGVAPPDFQEESSDFKITLTAKPKSRALNHWALLTIGILNRHYSEIEKDLEYKQRQHFQLRKEYLEEQLLYHRDVETRHHQHSVVDAIAEEEEVEDENWYQSHKGPHAFMTQNGYVPSSRPVSGKVLSSSEKVSEKITVDRPPSGVKSRVAAGKLSYRPKGGNADNMDITWADLLIEPTPSNTRIAKEADKVFDGLYHMNNKNNVKAEHCTEGDLDDVEDEDKLEYAYDDPPKYVTHGLFDASSALGSAPSGRKCSHPVSAVQQTVGDSLRSRPKSAVLPKGERFLKYEIIKPVPNKKRVQSASARLEQMPSKITNSTSTLTNGNMSERSQGSHREKSVRSKSHQTENAELEQEYREMKVRIRKPESVVRFEEDLITMNKMEDQFMKATKDLQKRLGISPSGIV